MTRADGAARRPYHWLVMVSMTKCTDATFSHATSYTLGRENFFETFPGPFVDCDLDDTGEVG